MVREKHVLGTLTIISSMVNPLLAVGFGGLTLWTYIEEYRRNQAAKKTMDYLISSNNRGLRSLVGDSDMNKARRLLAAKQNNRQRR